MKTWPEFQFKYSKYWITVGDDGIEVFDSKLDKSGVATWNWIIEELAPKASKSNDKVVR